MISNMLEKQVNPETLTPEASVRMLLEKYHELVGAININSHRISDTYVSLYSSPTYANNTKSNLLWRGELSQLATRLSKKTFEM